MVMCRPIQIWTGAGKCVVYPEDDQQVNCCICSLTADILFSSTVITEKEVTMV